MCPCKFEINHVILSTPDRVDLLGHSLRRLCTQDLDLKIKRAQTCRSKYEVSMCTKEQNTRAAARTIIIYERDPLKRSTKSKTMKTARNSILLFSKNNNHILWVSKDFKHTPELRNYMNTILCPLFEW